MQTVLSILADKSWNLVVGGGDSSKSSAISVLPATLIQPLKWKDPQVVLACPKGDLFHEGVPKHHIYMSLQMIQAFQQHIFLVPTRFPEQAKQAIESYVVRYGVESEWPPDNMWFGVFAEDQQQVLERVPPLVETNVRYKFICIDPMRGPVNLYKWLFNLRIPCRCGAVFDTVNASPCIHEGRTMACPVCGGCACDRIAVWKEEGKLLQTPGWQWRHRKVQEMPLLDLVVCGEGSWASELERSCMSVRVPFFLQGRDPAFQRRQLIDRMRQKGGGYEERVF